MKYSWRLAYLFLVLLILYVVYFVRSQALFERDLNSLFLSFDDFPPDYKQALDAAAKLNKSDPEYDYSTYPRADPALRIPRKIHFVWFQDLYEVYPNGTDIAHELPNTWEWCRYYNQDFEIKIWSETEARELIQWNHPWFLPTYDAYTYPIQRVDAFKYFLLLTHGGVYMDVDIGCRRNLTPLLQFPAWFPRASPLGVNNDLMASRPGHPILEKMTKTLESRNRNLLSPYLTIFWSTGPRFATDVLKMWIEGNDISREAENRFRVLPAVFYSEEYTFFGHRKGGSWYGTDVHIVLWFLARPWVIEISVLALVIGMVMFLFRTRILKSRFAYRRIEQEDK